MEKRIVLVVLAIIISIFFACAKNIEKEKPQAAINKSSTLTIASEERSDRVSDDFGSPLLIMAEKLLSDVLDTGDSILTDELLASRLGSKPDRIDVVEVKNLYEKEQIDNIFTYAFSGRTVKLYENTATKERYLLGLQITEKGNILLYGIDIGFEKGKLIQLLGYEQSRYNNTDTLSIVHNEGGASINFKFSANILVEINYMASM